jgi:ribosomal protein L11 methyltransferase
VPAEAAALFQLALEPFCVAVAAEAQGGPWRVTGYAKAPPEAPALETALAVAAAGAALAPPVPLVAPLPEVDWLAENQRSFPPVSVARFYISRSHHGRPPPDGRVALRLDASIAFGSGTHASTQGCLFALDALARQPRRRAPRRILDLGTGSGILAIAAAKLWPARIVAADIDRAATRLAAENAAANGVAARITLRTGFGLRALAPAARRQRARFHLVLANLHARPLAAMAPAFARRLRPGGRAVLSGLLRGDEPEVLAAYRAQSLVLAARLPLGEWVTLVLRRGARRATDSAARRVRRR